MIHPHLARLAVDRRVDKLLAEPLIAVEHSQQLAANALLGARGPAGALGDERLRLSVGIAEARATGLGEIRQGERPNLCLHRTSSFAGRDYSTISSICCQNAFAN